MDRRTTGCCSRQVKYCFIPCPDCQSGQTRSGIICKNPLFSYTAFLESVICPDLRNRGVIPGVSKTLTGINRWPISGPVGLLNLYTEKPGFFPGGPGRLDLHLGEKKACPGDRVFSDRRRYVGCVTKRRGRPGPRRWGRGGERWGTNKTGISGTMMMLEICSEPPIRISYHPKQSPKYWLI